MWDPAWLRNRSFWLETGLFVFFIILVGFFAVVKFNRPGQGTLITPTATPIPQVFYYLETDPGSGMCTVMRSDVSRPESPDSVAVLRSAPGSLPTGNLSPDGSRIMLLVTEPDASASEISNSIGSLWALRTDDESLQRLDTEPVTWFAWRQDGQALALFSPGSSTHPNPRLSKLNLVTGATTVLEEPGAVSQTMPLGWSAGGAEIVLIGLNASDRWTVYSLKADSSARVERITLVEGDILRNAWLGPNGAYLLIDLIRNQEALLLLFSLDGRQRITLASVGIGLMSNPPAYNPVWSDDGERILINQPSSNQSETTWKTYQVNGTSGTPIYLGDVDPTHFLRPLDWSGNEQWLAMIEGPYPSTHLFVKEITASDRIRILLQQTNDLASWLGFAPGP